MSRVTGFAICNEDRVLQTAPSQKTTTQPSASNIISKGSVIITNMTDGFDVDAPTLSRYVMQNTKDHERKFFGTSLCHCII